MVLFVLFPVLQKVTKFSRCEQPILERALQDRSTETKKAATLIISRLYSLTNPKVFATLQRVN
jgi:hypothetical protein